MFFSLLTLSSYYKAVYHKKGRAIGIPKCEPISCFDGIDCDVCVAEDGNDKLPVYTRCQSMLDIL